MKKLVWFWIVYGVFLAALFAGVLFVEKAELHLLLSQWVADCSKACTDVADWFMKNLTEIGSSFPFVVVGVCLFLKFGYSYVLLLGQGIATLIVQPIKHIVRSPRPKSYFAEFAPEVQLHQVDGVEMHSVMSFPSGHTAAAFALCLGVALLCKRNWVSAVCAVLAVLVGYSRIYLSQHFALDVAVGSVIGCCAALAANWLYERKRWIWEEKSLVTLIRVNKNRR